MRVQEELTEVQTLQFIAQCIALGAGIVLLIMCGRVVGRYITRCSESDKKRSISAIVSAILVLMSFMLALTYSMVSSRFSFRKQLLIDDVNAIETSYLRTDLLSPASRAQTRQLLRDYVGMRVNAIDQAVTSTVNPDILRRESIQIQNEIWRLAISDPSLKADTAGRILYIEALNNMFDTFSTRFYVGLQLRLQRSAWIMLCTLIGLGVFSLGVEFGLSGISLRAMTAASLLLALMLAVLLLYLAEMDKPGTSHIAPINQSPIRQLQFDMKENHR